MDDLSKKTSSIDADDLSLEAKNWYEKGRFFKKEGDLNNAIVCFQTILKNEPGNVIALNELYKCCLLEGRVKEGIDAVNALIKIYVSEFKKTEALTVYGELLQSQPDHCLDQADQVQLADWLEEFEDFAGAVAALTNYAKRYPHDKRSSDLLLRAAKICEYELGVHDQATAIAETISEKYPDSSAAGEAAMIFFKNQV